MFPCLALVLLLARAFRSLSPSTPVLLDDWLENAATTDVCGAAVCASSCNDICEDNNNGTATWSFGVCVYLHASLCGVPLLGWFFRSIQSAVCFRMHRGLSCLYRAQLSFSQSHGHEVRPKAADLLNSRTSPEAASTENAYMRSFPNASGDDFISDNS